MLTSLNNPKVKAWLKLKTRKGRKKASQYLIEGSHLVEEALRQAPQSVDTIILSQDHKDKAEAFGDFPVTIVSKEIEAALQDTETSQGIFAVLNLGESQLPKVIEKPYLFVDAVQDPGNLGTMIRTAAAADFQGVVLGKGTVDLYNDKTLRSAQGAHFKMDVQEGDLQAWMDHFHKLGLKVLGTALNPEAVDYRTVQESGPFGLILGNEGQGVQTDLLKQTDYNLYIPISDKVESLNVAIAAGILMFHLQASFQTENSNF